MPSIYTAANSTFETAIATPGDVESLVMTVMSQSAKEATQDLRAIVSEMKQSNETKGTLREMLGGLRDAEVIAATGTAGSRLTDVFSASLDSLSEQSEQFQLGLQRLMDNIAKAAATASNVMKKQSETQDSIIGNIK